MEYTIKTLKNLASAKVVTHDGIFHADDVLAGALLLRSGVIQFSSEIARVGRKDFESLENKDSYLVFDIGFGQFDHHQREGFAVRESGEKYAAFGLLWKSIGSEFIQNEYDVSKEIADKAAELFDDSVCKIIDLTDNFGQEKYRNVIAFTVNAAAKHALKLGNQVLDKTYYELVEFYESFFDESFELVIDQAKMELQAKSLGVNEIVDLEGFPHIESRMFKGTSAKFIVEKALGQQQYNLYAVDPVKIEKSKDELEGCTFVHAAKFMAAFTSKENAMNAAKSML